MNYLKSAGVIVRSQTAWLNQRDYAVYSKQHDGPPSSLNEQPWSFIVATKENMADFNI